MSGGFEIAIIGRAGRFPGAESVEQLWENVRARRESIRFHSPAELLAAGIPAELVYDPDYVPASGQLAHSDRFDAAFFGYSPREAALIDPQQRLFLETAYHALENAGYDARRHRGAIGVFAAVAFDLYLLRNLTRCAGDELLDLCLANDKDFLATRVAYELDLRGPAVSVQTACSSSLVAVHLACQSLLSGESDVCLAGGVSVDVPQAAGYLYRPEGVYARDGHCRPFDAQASGMVGGSGVAVVVLKRLDDALADRDSIRAVIKGSAINNDGAAKVGYTAPSVTGQAAAIRAAQAAAGVAPETITYLEAHGTGTPLGDPIEIAAASEAFATADRAAGWCAIGSIKANVGHLNSAAGVTGLIKTVEALAHRELPPQANFASANPQLALEGSPFYVNTEPCAWPSDGPRRAAVSSFGMGGTNAHVILEEAPTIAPTADETAQVLVLSAHSRAALERSTAQLSETFRTPAAPPLADAAFTLQVGRRQLSERAAVVCSPGDNVADALAKRTRRGTASDRRDAVAFLFSGQGAQRVGAGAALYREQESFRASFDRCADILRPKLGLDLRQTLGFTAEAPASSISVDDTAYAQPILFALEYAIAQWWIALGVRPSAMLGHSVGEWVAACLAGVVSLDDALAIMVVRGKLMQQAPRGAMLAVAVSEPQARELLTGGLSLAAVNGPSACVVSGPEEAIAKLSAQLEQLQIANRRLRTSHAFHSEMMDSVVDGFVAAVTCYALKAPSVPFVSNVTGTWITAAEATDPRYWGRQLRQTVRFADGVGALLQHPQRVMIEVGPGQALANLAGGHPARAAAQVVAATLADDDDSAHLKAIAELWLAGVEIDWPRLRSQPAQRVPLPLYPFEPQRHWIEPEAAPLTADNPFERLPVTRWLSATSWKRALVLPHQPRRDTHPSETWVVLGASTALTDALRSRVDAPQVILVRDSERFELGDENIGLRPTDPRHLEQLLGLLPSEGRVVFVHAWGAKPKMGADWTSFERLLALAGALARGSLTGPIELIVVTNGVYCVSGREVLHPERAAMLGPLRTLPQEVTHISCRHIDIDDESERGLLDELTQDGGDDVCALRFGQRWLPIYEAIEAPEVEPAALIRDQGVYLITGGLGGIGRSLAGALARAAKVRLALVGREDSNAAELTNAIHQQGSQARFYRADVSDAEQLRTTIAQVKDDYGRIDGVIHAAGVAGGRLLASESSDSTRAVLAPKVEGAQRLAAELERDELDFVVLCSSLAKEIGGAGQASYCAANAFLDSFAQTQPFGPVTRVLSIAWDTWRDVGMAVETEVPRELQASRAESLRFGMSAEDGAAVMWRALASGLDHVLVSTRPIDARIAHDRRRALSTGKALPLVGDQPPSPPDDSAEAVLTDSERLIADLWKRLLGVERVDRNDDFFNLGGHSLLATQMLNRLRNDFPHARLSLRTIVDQPTVAKLAAYIDGGAQAAIPVRHELEQSASRERQRSVLHRYLRARLAEGLGVTESELDDAPLDLERSAASVLWDVKRDLEVALHANEIADCSSLSALTELVLRAWSGEPGPAEEIVPSPVSATEELALPGVAASPPAMSINRRIVFLLSAPRSGSTLLRLMLAGHSQLFCPAELSLLDSGDMAQRRERTHTFERDALAQALSVALGIDAAVAGERVEQWVEQRRPTREVYAELQQAVEPRMLLDKTAGYALDRALLERAEETFERPYYLLLTRHPYAVIDSFVRHRLHALLGLAGDPFEVAEQVWATAHRNLLALAHGPAKDRCHWIRYEDLVRSPNRQLASVCSFLGLEFEPATLEPYAPGRMIDGPGDPDILQHQGIDAKLADAWRERKLPRELKAETIELARQLGYEIIPSGLPAVEPTSAALERLWTAHQLDPSNPAHAVRSLSRVRRPLDGNQLSDAINAVIARHEALRTTFRAGDGHPVQVIAPHAELAIKPVQVSDIDSPATAAVVKRFFAEPFDIENGPLLHVALIEDGRASLIAIAIHHIVADAASMGILLRDIARTYDRFAAGERARPPAPATQFRAYVAEKRSRDSAERRAADLDYWQAQLQDLRGNLAVPPDFSPPEKPTYATQRLQKAFSPNVAESVLRLGRELRVPPFAACVALFAAALNQDAGLYDVVFAVPLSDRDRQEWEELIGYFITLVPLRLDLSRVSTFRGLAEQARRALADATDHRDVAIDALHTRLQRGATPLFRMLVQYQSSSAKPLKMAGAEVEPLAIEGLSSRIDLALSLSEQNGSLMAQWEYRTEIYAPATIARLHQKLVDIAVRVAHDPTAFLIGARLPSAFEEDAARPAPPPRPRREDRPSTPAETLVAEVWCEHLQLAEVGTFDLFLDLGGHSLLAMRVIDAIEQRTGVRLLPADLATDNLAQLASKLERSTPSAKPSSEPARTRGLLARIFGR